MGISRHCTVPVHGEYFPHIDGIRALAVLPVVLFHLLPSLCCGGFAGVDVFFVISGYLITGGIVRDLDTNRFSIRNFYYRRMRRIMPAYFALIAGVFLIGAALFFATPLILLGDAVVAGTLFMANYNFWSIAGDYFAPALHSEALLHLWSLSVEEQFYLVIPILCAAIWKFRPRLVAPALALVAVVSLSGAVHAVMTGKQNDAFYLLHFRAWELLAGSLLAMLPAASRSTPARATPGFVNLPVTNSADNKSTDGDHNAENPIATETRYCIPGIVGLLLVLFSYVAISSQTPFPGAVAFVPVAGTALLVRYGQSGWVSELLCCRPFVLIGKISYSLYLWHWPVIVYWKYIVYDQVYVYDYVGMFLLSLLLGYSSWRFVELPVRISSAWTMRRTFTFAACGIALFVIAGTLCVYNKGWPTILHPEANEVAGMPIPKDPLIFRWPLYAIRYFGSKTGYNFRIVKEHENRISQERNTYFAGALEHAGRFGSSGQTEVFLFGDSHAGHLNYGLDLLLRERNIAGELMAHGAGDADPLHSSDVQLALGQLATLPHVSHVVIANNWARQRYQKQGQRRQYAVLCNRLEQFATAIKRMNKTPVIVTDVPYYPYAPADILARTQIITPRQTTVVLNSYEQTEAEYDRANGEVNEMLKGICERTGSLFVPLHLAFKVGDCYVSVERRERQIISLYRDKHHLSARGSLRAATTVIAYLYPSNRRVNTIR